MISWKERSWKRKLVVVCLSQIKIQDECQILVSPPNQKIRKTLVVFVYRTSVEGPWILSNFSKDILRSDILKRNILKKKTCSCVPLANQNIIHLAHFNREGYSWVSTNQKNSKILYSRWWYENSRWRRIFRILVSWRK